MSLVVKKVSYGVALRFPAFGVDVSKELSESELRQFYTELKRLESAVADQLGTFASVIASPSFHAQAVKENMERILQYAQGKQLFKAAEVELDLELSKNVVWLGLTRLVADKKLVRLKLPPHGAYGYSLVKQSAPIPAVEVECDEAKIVRENLKRLKAAEVQAKIDSR